MKRKSTAKKASKTRCVRCDAPIAYRDVIRDDGEHFCSETCIAERDAARRKERNPIGRHRTTIRPDERGAIEVTYHATVVARRNADGTVTLNSGGYKTATTKKRINQALEEWGFPFGIWQERGAWYVGTHREPSWRRPFVDGMTIPGEGPWSKMPGNDEYVTTGKGRFLDPNDPRAPRKWVKRNPAHDDAARRRKFMKATGIADVANHPARSLRDASGFVIRLEKGVDLQYVVARQISGGGINVSDRIADAKRFSSEESARWWAAGHKIPVVAKRNGYAVNIIVVTGDGVKRNPGRRSTAGLPTRADALAYPVGERVQLGPHNDTWMRGDRYGEVVGHTRDHRVKIKLDKSGRVKAFHPANIGEIVR